MPTIDDLRNELFDTIKRLKSKDEPMDVARAKAVVEVASVLVDTARVEVAMLEATGEGDTGFIRTNDTGRRLTAPTRPQLAAGASR